MNRTLRSILAAGAVLCGFAAPTHAQQKIVFLTDAGPLGRHSLFFVAKEKAHHRRKASTSRSSAVVVRPRRSARWRRVPRPSVADSGTLILSRANENVPVKMIGIVYARAPHAMMALKSSGITGPKDLPGRTLADTSASSNYILFAAYARASGIDPNSVKWVFTDFNSLPGLLVTKQVDAIGQFTMGQPMLQQRVPNDAIVVLSYKDAGMEFYSTRSSRPTRRFNRSRPS